MDLTSFWVELGELVTVEAVEVVQIAESHSAIGHVLERFLFHFLGFKVEVEDLMCWGKRGDIMKCSADDSSFIVY